MNRLFYAYFFAAFAASNGAAAADLHECTRGADVRTIEVRAPGEVGAACDLKYVRGNGANVSVPYHADNSPEFCAERARTMIRALEDAGYKCVAAAEVGEPPELRAEVEPRETLDEIHEASLADTPADPVAVEIPAPPTEHPDATLEQPVAPQVAAADAAPAPAVASRGPAALAPTNASAPATPAVPAGSAVGRITGAGPQQAAAPMTVASAAKPAPLKPRTQEEIIRSVLLAQTAAWNDADLEAFLDTFWKSNDFRLIAGDKVAAGWTQAADLYRSRFGEAGDFGRLSRDGLEIEMVSDDVAIASGRYNLVRAAGAESGSLTLVVKRIDGLWRIVHAHSNVDKPSTE